MHNKWLTVITSKEKNWEMGKLRTFAFYFVYFYKFSNLFKIMKYL